MDAYEKINFKELYEWNGENSLLFLLLPHLLPGMLSKIWFAQDISSMTFICHYNKLMNGQIKWGSFAKWSTSSSC